MSPYRSRWMQPWTLLLWGLSKSFLSHLGPFHTPPGPHTQIFITGIKFLHSFNYQFLRWKTNMVIPIYFGRKILLGFCLKAADENEFAWNRSFSPTAQINNSNKQKHYFTRRFEICTGPFRTLTWIQLNICEVMWWLCTRGLNSSILCKEEQPNIVKSRHSMPRLNIATGSWAEYCEKSESGFLDSF